VGDGGEKREREEWTDDAQCCPRRLIRVRQAAQLVTCSWAPEGTLCAGCAEKMKVLLLLTLLVAIEGEGAMSLDGSIGIYGDRLQYHVSVSVHDLLLALCIRQVDCKKTEYECRSLLQLDGYGVSQ